MTLRWDLLLLVGVLSFASGCGDWVVDLQYSTEDLRFRDVDPGEGPQTLRLEVVNIGDGPVAIYGVRLENRSGDCGDFSMDAYPPYPSFESGERWTITVTFAPSEGATSGCACFARARLAFDYDIGQLNRSLPITARGSCDAPLGCTHGSVEFTDAVIESTYETEIGCVNLSESEVEVVDVEVGGGDSNEFSLGPTRPVTPALLAPGGGIDFTVTFHPTEEGDFEEELVIVGQDDELASILLSGSAERARPHCTATPPEDPEPVLIGPNYEVFLESEDPSTYTGTIRSFWYYDDQPPLIADYLVTSGSYADPACEVGQTGHMAYWRGEECQVDGGGGLFANVHALPYSALVDEWLRSLSEWDVVTIRGYEVERIDYDDSSWWTDAGCNTLIITWVCDAD